jgi:hypothetical protein
MSGVEHGKNQDVKDDDRLTVVCTVAPLKPIIQDYVSRETLY